jgi:hypothetical protein
LEHDATIAVLNLAGTLLNGDRNEMVSYQSEMKEALQNPLEHANDQRRRSRRDDSVVPCERAGAADTTSCARGAGFDGNDSRIPRCESRACGSEEDAPLAAGAWQALTRYRLQARNSFGPRTVVLKCRADGGSGSTLRSALTSRAQFSEEVFRRGGERLWQW